MTPAEKLRKNRAEIEDQVGTAIHMVSEGSTSQYDLNVRLELLAYELAKRSGHMVEVLRTLGAIDDDDIETFGEVLADHLVRNTKLKTAPEPSFDWQQFRKRAQQNMPVSETGGDHLDLRTIWLGPNSIFARRKRR
jgi:hypothetical protein